MPMNFQRAVVEDAEALANLDLALFDEDGLGPSTFRREIEEGCCIMHVIGGDIIGYALLRPDPVVNDLMRLGVRPAYQRMGVGRALLREARAELPGKMLLLVRKVNKRALKLYKSEGFKIEGALNDSWLMIV